MPESLILIVLLIIIDTAMLFICDACDARLTTMRSARNGVWTHATKACRGNASTHDTVVSLGGGDSSLSPAARHMTRARSIARGQTLTKPLETSLRVASASSEKTSGSHGTAYESFAGLTMSTQNSVLCNERQESISEGDIRSTINALYGRWL